MYRILIEESHGEDWMTLAEIDTEDEEILINELIMKIANRLTDLSNEPVAVKTNIKYI